MDNIYKTPDAELTSNSGEAGNYALYKLSGIGIATFVGSVLAGGYLAYRNLKFLGREKQAKNVLLGSVIATLAVFAIAFLLPEDLNIPNTVFTVVQLVVMLQLSKSWFQKDIEEHSAKGGELASNWRAFGIALLFVLVLIIMMLPIAFLLV